MNYIYVFPKVEAIPGAEAGAEKGSDHDHISVTEQVCSLKATLAMLQAGYICIISCVHTCRRRAGCIIFLYNVP